MSGRTGFVHQAVLDDFADLSGHQVYACGAPSWSIPRAAYTTQRGLPPEEFYADAFTSEADKHLGFFEANCLISFYQINAGTLQIRVISRALSRGSKEIKRRLKRRCRHQ